MKLQTLLIGGLCALSAIACSHNETPDSETAVPIEDRTHQNPTPATAAQTPNTAPIMTPAAPASQVLSVSERWGFEQRDHGYTVRNPIQALDFHFRNNHVSATRGGGDWTWTWTMLEAGRPGAMTPVRPAAPDVRACQTDACDTRLEYRRQHITEWYMNTLQGVEQGFDVEKRVAGEGLLTLTAAVDGLTARMMDDGQTISFEKDGVGVFTYSDLWARDALGRQLPTTMSANDGLVTLQVDDTDAAYPIVIDPMASACPAAWCNDGDVSTIDICWQRDQKVSCVRLFDEAYDWEECTWGEFCCEDGLFHEDCDAPSDGSCPDKWCDDDDFTTTDQCKNFSAPDSFECKNWLDEAAEGEVCNSGKYCCDGIVAAECDADPAFPDAAPVGEPCPAGWCNDGDPTTADICQMIEGERECSSALDEGLLGEACSYGTYCCDGIVVEEPCEVPPDSAVTFPCPNEWCDDGDITTLDQCSDFEPVSDSFTCSAVFDESMAGEPCTEGLYCCIEEIMEVCDLSKFPGQCPDSWCDDGDPTTVDACGDFTDGGFECTRTFNKAEDGKACSYGYYCCNGVVSELCAADPPPAAPLDPPPAAPADPPPASPPADPPPASDDGGGGCSADGANFAGGSCVDDAPGFCGTTAGAQEISPSDQLIVGFSSPANTVTLRFGHTAGATGAMMAVGTDGLILGVVTSSGNCTTGKQGKTTVDFGAPIGTLIVSAAGGAVYIDDLVVQ